MVSNKFLKEAVLSALLLGTMETSNCYAYKTETNLFPKYNFQGELGGNQIKTEEHQDSTKIIYSVSIKYPNKQSITLTDVMNKNDVVLQFDGIDEVIINDVLQKNDKKLTKKWQKMFDYYTLRIKLYNDSKESYSKTLQQ
jgi:hypothetical protein